MVEEEDDDDEEEEEDVDNATSGKSNATLGADDLDDKASFDLLRVLAAVDESPLHLQNNNKVMHPDQSINQERN